MKPATGHKASENMYDNHFFLFHQNLRCVCSRRRAQKLKVVFTYDLKWSNPEKYLQFPLSGFLWVFFFVVVFLFVGVGGGVRMTSGESGISLTCDSQYFQIYIILNNCIETLCIYTLQVYFLFLRIFVYYCKNIATLCIVALT